MMRTLLVLSLSVYRQQPGRKKPMVIILTVNPQLDCFFL